MKVIIGERQSGKTTKLLQQLKENNNAVMGVSSEMKKIRLIQENPELKDRIKTYCELKNSVVSNDFDECYLDDIDLLLHTLDFKIPITYVSITGDIK